MYLSVCLFVCHSVHSFVHVSVCPFVTVSIRLSMYLCFSICHSVHSFVHVSVRLSVCHCVHSFVHVSVCLSVCLSQCSLRLSMHLCVCPFVCLLPNLLNTVFWKRLNRYWCLLAQVVHGARAWDGKLWGSRGQRTRSHEDEYGIHLEAWRRHQFLPL